MIYNLFQAITKDIMNNINDIINYIVNNKKGHHIVNDINQIMNDKKATLVISQTAYLFLPTA